MRVKLAALIAVALLASGLILYLPDYEAVLFLSGILLCSACIFFPKELMGALILFLPFQKMLTQRFEIQMPLLSVFLKRMEEGIVLVVFITLVGVKALHDRYWKRTPLDAPLILLVILALLSTYQSHLVSLPAALFDLFLLLKGFLVFYIFCALRLTKRDVTIIIKAVSILAFICLLFAFIDLAIPNKLRSFLYHDTWIEYRGSIPSVQSFFVNPGVYGWFMAFISSFALAFFLVLGKKKYLVTVLLFGLGTLLAMKLKPILGLAAATCTAFFLVSKTRKTRLLAAIFFLVLVLSFFFNENIRPIFENRIYTYIQARGSFAEARNVLYKTGFRIAFDYFPLGSGLATFGGWIAAIYYSPLYSHYSLSAVWGLERGGRFLTDTFWPYVIGQFGIFGFFLYLCILIALFRIPLNVFRISDDLFWKAFSLGAMLILIEGIVESIAEPVFLSPPQYYFIFACYGVLHYVNSSLKKSVAT